MGANGTGKSTLFAIFGFLRDAMNANVRTALAKLGGSRGFREIRSRNGSGPIEIEIKYRMRPRGALVTYLLSIDEEQGRPVVARELLATGACGPAGLGTFWTFAAAEALPLPTKPKRQPMHPSSNGYSRH